MAQITFFHYVHKETIIHRMDGRLKLLCMLLLSISASLASEWQHYLLALVVALLGLLLAKLPIIALLRDMKYFAIIIIVVFVSNAVNISGDPIPGIPLNSVSIQGVEAGLRFAGRLILIIMVCIVLTGTTTLWSFRNIVEWYLRPLPFVPEARVATMINLTFVLIPVIFDNFAEMMDAQKSRGIELRKIPIRRIKYLAFPLLSRTLRRADEIVWAMESRCYSETRTKAAFTVNKADVLILAVCLAVFVLGFL